MTAGTAPVFVVTATAGSTVLTSSNTVNVKAGRFLDASGNGYDGRIFALLQESEPITPISLVAPFAISTPTKSQTLLLDLPIRRMPRIFYTDHWNSSCYCATEQLP
jgi:hypothetical protein